MIRLHALSRPPGLFVCRATLVLGLWLAFLLSAGCSLLPGAGSPDEAQSQESVTPDALAEETVAATSITNDPTAAVPSPEPTAAPSATPEPTPIVATVEIVDQTVTEDGVVVIELVSLPQPGWLALYDASAIGDEGFLGAVPVNAGVHEDITVEIEARSAPASLAAMLYIGRESGSEFAPPQGEAGLAAATTTFTVDVQLPRSEIEVADQEVGDDGELEIATILATEPAWILVHADENGASGAVVGRLRVEQGLHENVIVPIRWREGTPRLHIVFHEDSGEPGVLEFPEGDLPVVADGEPVTATVNVTYPPDVVIFDQPVVNGEIIIERAISNGPGWVAIHFDDDGQPGLIIGSVALEDGLNELLRVDLIEEAITPVLYARLHTDDEPGGEFDFPRSDPPVRYEDRLPEANAFRVDAGSYLVIEDQTLGEDATVLASLVVSVTNGWLAIYADDEGERGELLGQTGVAEGLNRGVKVSLDPEPAPGLLHAVLHQDQGEVETFEYPDGPDTPVRVQGADIDVPFLLLADSSP